MTKYSDLEKFLPRDGIEDGALDEVRLELCRLDIGRVTVTYFGDKEPFNEFDLGGTFAARIVAMEHGISSKVKALPWTPIVLRVAEDAYQTS